MFCFDISASTHEDLANKKKLICLNKRSGNYKKVLNLNVAVRELIFYNRDRKFMEHEAIDEILKAEEHRLYNYRDMPSGVFYEVAMMFGYYTLDNLYYYHRENGDDSNITINDYNYRFEF